MFGISIIIVDDDKLLVKKLKETLNWEGMGIGMVFTAYNIRQAKELLTEYPIEILLCDIDMPQGSGLELLEWIRDESKNIECIFLSSYANFAYAQKALKLSSKEYLLKPISNTDLEHVIRKIAEEVSEKKESAETYADNKKESYWKDFLINTTEEEILINEALEKELYKNDEMICMVMVKLLENPSAPENKKDIMLHDFVIRNIAWEFFRSSPQKPEAIVRMTDMEWMLVFNSVTDYPHLKNCIKGLKANFDGGVFKKNCIYMGLPRSFVNSKECHHSIEHMEKHGVPDNRAIIYEDEWFFGEREYNSPPWEAWNLEMVQSDTLMSAKESIVKYIDEQNQKGNWRKNYLDRFIIELTQSIYVYLNQQGLGFEQIFDSHEFVVYERAAHISITGLTDFTEYLFKKLEGNKLSYNLRDNVIQQLKEYIEQHLHENLSRTVLANEVYLSEDYVSKIFAKSTGMSITSYIANRRIQKAKEYLENSSLPVSKIAVEVGYCNFSYFSKIFREIVGVTPNEYRSKTLK